MDNFGFNRVAAQFVRKMPAADFKVCNCKLSATRVKSKIKL